MYLQPKKTKYRKYAKGKIKGLDTRGAQLKFGTYGLKTLEPARLTARQIEATRRTITKVLKKTGKLWLRVFPDIPVTAKPAEVRMGKGKGSVDHWVCKVKTGRILFELAGVSSKLAVQALLAGGTKLPVDVRFVNRDSLV